MTLLTREHFTNGGSILSGVAKSGVAKPRSRRDRVSPVMNRLNGLTGEQSESRQSPAQRAQESAAQGLDVEVGAGVRQALSQRLNGELDKAKAAAELDQKVHAQTVDELGHSCAECLVDAHLGDLLELLERAELSPDLLELLQQMKEKKRERDIAVVLAVLQQKAVEMNLEPAKLTDMATELVDSSALQLDLTEADVESLSSSWELPQADALRSEIEALSGEIAELAEAVDGWVPEARSIDEAAEELPLDLSEQSEVFQLMSSHARQLGWEGLVDELEAVEDLLREVPTVDLVRDQLGDVPLVVDQQVEAALGQLLDPELEVVEPERVVDELEIEARENVADELEIDAPELDVDEPELEDAVVAPVVAQDAIADELELDDPELVEPELVEDEIEASELVVDELEVVEPELVIDEREVDEPPLEVDEPELVEPAPELRAVPTLEEPPVDQPDRFVALDDPQLVHDVQIDTAVAENYRQALEPYVTALVASAVPERNREVQERQPVARAHAAFLQVVEREAQERASRQAAAVQRLRALANEAQERRLATLVLSEEEERRLMNRGMPALRDLSNAGTDKAPLAPLAPKAAAARAERSSSAVPITLVTKQSPVAGRAAGPAGDKPADKFQRTVSGCAGCSGGRGCCSSGQGFTSARDQVNEMVDNFNTLFATMHGPQFAQSTEGSFR